MAEKNKWANFATKMSAKRQRTTTAKKKGGQSVKEEIIVQRMSSSVSGKAQKYSRIGPREFVPFEKYDGELTLKNIMDACQAHFAKRIDKDMVCDVLAGEQGPSCRKVEHIPDVKVIHVRFVKSCDLVIDEAQEESPFNDNEDDYSPPALLGPSDSEVSIKLSDIHTHRLLVSPPRPFAFFFLGLFAVIWSSSNKDIHY